MIDVLFEISIFNKFALKIRLPKSAFNVLESMVRHFALTQCGGLEIDVEKVVADTMTRLKASFCYKMGLKGFNFNKSNVCDCGSSSILGLIFTLRKVKRVVKIVSCDLESEVLDTISEIVGEIEFEPDTSPVIPTERVIEKIVEDVESLDKKIGNKIKEKTRYDAKPVKKIDPIPDD